MKSLEQQRRAIGDSLTAERKAIGQAMISRRNASSSVDDLNSVVRAPAARRTLRQVPVLGSEDAKKGRADWDPQAAGPISSGGIASPLTEVPGSREYAEEFAYVETIDGSGYFRVKLVSKLTMTDADGATVVINLDAGS